MLYFSCDLCGQSLGDERIFVQIVGQAVTDDRLELDPTVEHDHLQALEASLAANAEELPSVQDCSDVTISARNASASMRKIRWDVMPGGDCGTAQINGGTSVALRNVSLRGTELRPGVDAGPQRRTAVRAGSEHLSVIQPPARLESIN